MPTPEPRGVRGGSHRHEPSTPMDLETNVSDVKITVSLDGSLKVEGAATLLDHRGDEVPTREDKPFFLCRCGASENKPFCDGSHKRVEFKGS